MISAVTEEATFIFLMHMNRLILILCYWLLKKGIIVIMTNLTNPESAFYRHTQFNKKELPCQKLIMLLEKNKGKKYLIKY